MYSWLSQRVTAVLLLIFLSVHVIVSHYPVREVTFQDVLTRLDYPGWKAFYILFLATVLYHALNGVWIVVRDFKGLKQMQKPLLGLAILAGLVFLYFGAEVIWTFTLR
jgi:succinate dehydrogenase / fumarate reductase cytochrome b subunit